MHRSVQLLALLVWLCPSIAAADWPHPRGPRFDGTISSTETVGTDPIGLELSWRVPLGPGYSAISVSGGLAVTAYGDAEACWVAAFDTSTGRRVWRSRLGAPHLGRDGPTDGPLSSPVIGHGVVYALAPRGGLLALRLSDGTEIWKRDLEQDVGARRPDFGFTTTPLPAGEVIVVQTGGGGNRAIVGLDAQTGETRWSLGDDKIEYQSPAVMSLAGLTQVVAVGVKQIVGIDPETGQRLWTHHLGDGDETFSTSPTFIGEDRFVVSLRGVLTGYRLSRIRGGRYRLEELFRSQAFGSTYAAPVYHDGYIYGFRRQILTCADATTGERLWRSRRPGGGGLILVDDRLVIFAAEGHIVVADASPEGYRELARVQALDGSSFTWPSFAEGRVFVRNLEEIAAVEIGSVPATRTLAAEPAAPDHEMARWVARIEAAKRPTKVIEELIDQHPRWPIVDGDYLHFLYRADAEDVAFAGSMLDSGAPVPMKRIADTDLFYLSFQLELGCRWEYRFLVDYETWFPDPRNPVLVPIPGEQRAMASEVVTGEYTTASHLVYPGDSAGRIESLEWPSKVFDGTRRVDVWLPPGYDAGSSDASYPLLVVNDGPAWQKDGLLPNTLGNLVGERIPPLIVAFVVPGAKWWLEAGGGRTDDYVRMLAEELVPALGKRYRLTADRRLMGNQSWGASSLIAALRHPGLFDRVGIQSPTLGLGAGPAVHELIDSQAGADTVQLYVDWNRYDLKAVDSGIDLAEEGKALVEALRSAGYRVSGGEVLDSYGWSGWRNRSDRLLAELFAR